MKYRNGQAYTVFFFDTFPKQSERFLHREVVGVVRNGNNIRIAALKKERGDVFPVAVSGVFGDDTSIIDLFFALFSCVLWKCAFQLLFSVGIRGLFFPFRHLRAFGRFYRRLPNAKSIHSAHAGWCGISAWILSKMLGIPFTFSCHARDVFVQERILKFLSRRAEKIVTCNKSSFNRVIEVCGVEKKLHLVHHPLPKIELRDDAGIVPNRLISAGRAVEKKGFKNLIKSVARLREKDKSLSLLLLGPSAADFPNGLPDWVTATGFLSEREYFKKLSTAKLFVYSSQVTQSGDRDGIPNVIIEAMALGIPVVATDAGSISEVIIDKVTGLLVAQNDPVAFSEAVSELLGKPELCREISQNARKLVRDEFDYHKQVSVLSAILDLKIKRESNNEQQ